jgi:HK97 family phage prohead protease
MRGGHEWRADSRGAAALRRLCRNLRCGGRRGRRDCARRLCRQPCAARRGGLPLLWQHQPDQPIGRIDTASEDDRGLRVTGTICGTGSAARHAAALLRAGRLDGLSFGYRVVAAQGEHPRRLAALDLVEVSLVTHPMQPLARVHALA